MNANRGSFLWVALLPGVLLSWLFKICRWRGVDCRRSILGPDFCQYGTGERLDTQTSSGVPGEGAIPLSAAI